LPKKTFAAAEVVGSTVLVQVKDNQPSLAAALDDIACVFEPSDTCETREMSRNRDEYRLAAVYQTADIIELADWKDYVKVAIRVYRRTWIKDSKTRSWVLREEISWYITNEIDRTAEFYAAAIRGHWGIENRDHRVRDGAFAEDASRIRVAPANCARIRSFAMNIFRFNDVENITNEMWLNALSFDRATAYCGL
jgi:predicted transposase YbfD/YdcC